MEETRPDIFALIDELQEELEMSPTAMFSKKKAVELDLFLEIIGDMRAALPEEIEKSAKVMHDREQIIEAARAQAQEIVDVAKERAEQMVNESEITELAYEKANKIVATAKAQASEIRKSANTYAEEVLSELETYFIEYVELIRENKSRIDNKIVPVTEETQDEEE